MRVVGIDPGVSPTVCLLIPPENGKPIAAQWWEGDETSDTVRVNAKARRRCSPSLLAGILREATPGAVFIERVNAMPAEGVSSAFNFGRAFGICEAVAIALDYPVYFVNSRVWRKALQVPEGKTGSRFTAGSIAPTLAGNYKLVKDHNRADSFLIAYYGALELQRSRLQVKELAL